MKQRIVNPRSKDYANYGGRGLTMDPRWHNFEAFLGDMGERLPHMTLGRIDNALGYWPDNCRWETYRQQQNNRRSNVFIEFRGERLTIAQWARRIGVPRQTIRYRLRAGWPPEDITSPVVNRNIRRKS